MPCLYIYSINLHHYMSFTTAVWSMNTWWSASDWLIYVECSICSPSHHIHEGSSGSMNYRGWERGTEISIVQVRFMDSLGCYVYWQRRSKNHLTLDKEIGGKSLFPLTCFHSLYCINDSEFFLHHFINFCILYPIFTF